MPEFDINASADQVAALFKQGRGTDALARLDTLRHGQPPVVQEALDRYVARRATAEVNAMYALSLLPMPGMDAVAPSEPLGRLIAANYTAPRFPADSETARLSQAQQYDIYASVIGVRGDQAARAALNTQDRVILGMRNDTRTTANHGAGVYDDRIVVVWKDDKGVRHAREFNHSNTEPSAQYDHHAGSDGTRVIAESGGQVAPRLKPSRGYEHVDTRKIEGEDVNNDRIRDMGRLGEGTTEMRADAHPTYGANPGEEFALRPTAAAVGAGANRVQRDTNADGWFNARDVNGLQALNDTFKIHRGGSSNTDSAGCQTIGGGEYDDFITAVGGNQQQTRWQYVLTSVAPAQTQQRAQPAGGAGPRADAGTPEGADPRHPANPPHADHRLHGQIDGHLRALGGEYARNADAIGLSLLAAAKAGQITQADSLVPNRADNGLQADETLFLIQGRPGDPAARRVALSVELAASTPVQASLARLDALNQADANPAAPQAAEQAPGQDAAPRRMG
ncbi:XVIPCD domain-containing protein [Lysobacter silvisoli]|uniref:X-Tfes XVIPCD domain-containing protein n=1 Tax=Lysobacter silvisoli TaxID=2293254 RepID=A0A371K1S1_9GAMM|nr:XVIPCD domain-containing protein [Lysobacter silvisoli]RDZ27802.1 hypothetical protein DX914_01115 [Lysobacter silvisoli]